MTAVRRACASVGLLLFTAVPAPAAAETAGTPAAPPCAECVSIVLPASRVDVLPARLDGLLVLIDVRRGGAPLERLQTVRSRGGEVGLLLGVGDVDDLPETSAAPAAAIILAVPGGEPETVAFEVKTALTALRAAAPAAQLGISADGPIVSALLARGVTDYLDVVATSGTSPPSGGVRWWRRADLVLDAAGAVDAAGTLAAERWLWTAPADDAALSRLATDLSRLMPGLPRGLVPVPDTRARCGTQTIEAWLNPTTLELVSWTEGCPPDRIEAPPGHTLVEAVSLASGHALLRFSSQSAGRFADDVDVRAPRQLTAGEIVARHQAARARQEARVHSVISTGTLTLTFEAPGFPAPVTITSSSIIFMDEETTDIEQRDILVNGLAFGGRGVPRLPLLEPERVASPPLTIALTDVYRYALAGRETVEGIACYVIAFEPATGKQSLFRGRAWIAADSFAMVRVSAAQTALRGPIVSSEQIDDFRQVQAGVWLLARSDVRQMYEGAGYRTPIHRVLDIVSHEVNPPGFTARRARAYAAAPIMLRDTPEGYRYLERQAGGAGEPPSVAPAGPSDRIRTIAAGVIVDPNISRPLPFGGLSYMDFDLFGTGTQVNGFFGVSYGQLAVAVPSLRGTRWQLGGRAFAIATEFHDRAFVEGREVYAHNVLQRPAHASVWLLRPLSPRVVVRAGYEFDFTRVRPAESTADDFVVPADQIAHGLRLVVEGQRAGWSGSVWWNPVVRSGWRRWGGPGDGEFDHSHDSFQRYGLTVARAAVLSPALVARAEASWMAGRDLDRFSRYSFGAFENRLRGYPAALIRYDRGGALRGALAWSAGRRLRLDGFVDTALVHDPGFGPGLRRFTGVGAAVEAPAPAGTLLAVEWGFGVQGVTTTGRRGTHVVRVTAYKMF